MGFVAFFGTALGRKVLVGLLLAVSIGGVFYKVYQWGRSAGQLEAFEAMREENEKRWDDMQRLVNAQYEAAAEQIATVSQKVEEVRVQKQKVVTQTVVHETKFETAHAAIAPEVEAALVSTPEVIKQELAIYREETAVLREDIKELAGLVDTMSGAIDDLKAAHATEVRSLESALALVTEQRDFYQTAYENTGGKKPMGFWRCVAKKLGHLGFGSCK